MSGGHFLARGKVHGVGDAPLWCGHGSILQVKTVKTPDFLHESSQSGAFCISAAILIYLQRLLPIFSISGGDKSAPTRRIKIFFDYLLFFNQKNVIIKNIRRGYGEKTFDMLKRYCNNNHTAAGGI